MHWTQDESWHEFDHEGESMTKHTEKEVKDIFFQKLAELIYEDVLEPLGW
jgi:hypothetical protein